MNVKKEKIKILIGFEFCLLVSIILFFVSCLKQDYNSLELSIGFIMVNILYQIQFYKDFKEF